MPLDGCLLLSRGNIRLCLSGRNIDHITSSKNNPGRLGFDTVPKLLWELRRAIHVGGAFIGWILVFLTFRTSALDAAVSLLVVRSRENRETKRRPFVSLHELFERTFLPASLRTLRLLWVSLSNEARPPANRPQICLNRLEQEPMGELGEASREPLFAKEDYRQCTLDNCVPRSLFRLSVDAVHQCYQKISLAILSHDQSVLESLSAIRRE